MAGLVRHLNVKWLAIYEVSEDVQKFLTRCNRGSLGFVFRLHRCGFKYPVVKGPDTVLDWRRVPKACGHWTALIGSEGGVRVEQTTRNVIVW